MKKINLIIILISFFLVSCQSVKDGLSGKKNENSDEFLVKKKNPLVLPPNFMQLPTPENSSYEDEISELEEATNIENILNMNKQTDNSGKKNTKGSVENFVLNQINKK